jgi:hypothetical protein
MRWNDKPAGGEMEALNERKIAPVDRNLPEVTDRNWPRTTPPEVMEIDVRSFFRLVTADNLLTYWQIVVE